MKLLILCVDGFDPDYGQEYGFNKFRYSARLSIPAECFIESPDGPQPTTGRVWPTILSGRVQSHSLIERKGLRKRAHDFLLRRGITWTRGRPSYQVNPWNEDLETVLTGRLAFTWNIPTISPEWVVRFPDMVRLMAYCNREYQMFNMMAQGVQVRGSGYELAIIYTRIVDAWGHFKKAEDMKFIYSDVTATAWRLAQAQQAQGDELLFLSDHGCLNGVHTDKAFIGATFPFEAESITDVRGVIEGVLNA